MSRQLTDDDLERVRAFLERHLDTSLFLLSTLAALGPRLGEHPNSGNFRLIEERRQIVAVFCLTRRGNLLVQAGGRSDLAPRIFAACRGETIEKRGIVGEWATAEALWRLLRADPSLQPTHSLKDVLYRLSLVDACVESPGAQSVRLLQAGDYSQWEKLNDAYFAELRLPVDVTPEQRQTDYVVRIRSGLWWGAFNAASELTSIAGLNATYGSVAQVGGVYTRPQERRTGLAGQVLRQLIRDTHHRLGFERLILFTGEANRAARRLYESLGFELAGEFGLLLGERRRAQPRAAEHHQWSGQSGETYTYEVFEWPARLTPGPGNYVLATHDDAGAWQPLFVGESPDLSAVDAEDRLQSGARRSRATHIHVRPNFNPAASRKREVNDLCARWLAGKRDG